MTAAAEGFDYLFKILHSSGKCLPWVAPRPFSVPKQVGLRGARTAAQTVKPDIGIAIEGGIAGDTAGARPEETQAKLAAGPGMSLFDSSTIANRKMVAFTRKTATTKWIAVAG